LDFFKQESDAKTLAAPKLRVVNNKSASINVGDKQPILLSTTNVLPGQAATGAVPTTSTVTSIEFKDVGVKLTVEPSINLMNEVTMKLKIEVTRLGDQVILQASPEIKQFKFGTRSAETVLMLKDDETVVLAGLIQDEDRKTRTTIPFVEYIPTIGTLLTGKQEDRVSTEVVLTITPRVVRSMDPPSFAAQAFWSGTENTFATSQLYAPHPVTVSQPGGSSQLLHPMPAILSGEAAPSPPSSSQPLPIGLPRPTDATQSSSNLVGMATGPVILRPLDVALGVSQEFRIDLAALHLEQFSDALVTVTFDPAALEFRRATPGLASLSARTNDGQLVLALQRQGPSSQGDGVLAMLFFQAKTPGRFPISLQVLPAQGSTSAVNISGSSRAIVQVR
jgi:general secretion pathway protein D